MGEKVIKRCPFCDFIVTQTTAEILAQGHVVRHLNESHEEEFLELIRKALEKEAGK